VLSKLLTEEAAFKFAKEHGLDLVSVITTTVAGTFLTSTVPSSIRVLLSPITGLILMIYVSSFMSGPFIDGFWEEIISREMYWKVLKMWHALHEIDVINIF